MKYNIYSPSKSRHTIKSQKSTSDPIMVPCSIHNTEEKNFTYQLFLLEFGQQKAEPILALLRD